MVNKIKNMIGKVMILVLMWIMVIPTSVFGATPPDVSSWDEYGQVLKEGIMNQEEEIIIKFNKEMRFLSEGIINEGINNAYKQAINNVPLLLGEKNIKGIVKTTPIIEKVSNTSYNLKEVRYNIEYINKIDEIDKYLNVKIDGKSQYDAIKALPTAYERIQLSYNYILENLEHGVNAEYDILNKDKNGISTNPVASDAYALLLSIMMDELGYENIVVSGTIGGTEDKHSWNMVKVQGNWYHIDSRLGDLEPEPKNKYLLTSDNIMITKYNQPLESSDLYKVENIYNSSNSINYEIKFIENNIDDSFLNLLKLYDEIGIINSPDEIKSIKIKNEIEREKMIGYKNSIEALSNKGYLDNKLMKLINTSTKVLVKIAENTMLVEDISTAKQTVENLSDEDIKIDLSVKIKNIELAIETVETAEKGLSENNSVLDGNILNAKTALGALSDISKDSKIYMELISRLEKVEKLNDAKKAIYNAESKLKGYVAVDTGIKYAYDEAIKAKNLINPIVDSKYSGIIKDLNIIITDIEKISFAKDKVMKAQEAPNTKVKNDEAKKYINLIDIKYDKPKKDLNSIILVLEETLKNSVIEEINARALKAVDEAKSSIETISESVDLDGIIKDAEAKIKTADGEVKKIQDTTFKTAQQNRMKDIKLVLSAIKSLEKAEISPSGKTAKSAINTISQIPEAYQSLKVILESRVKIIDNAIKLIDAEKLINVVEKTLKSADYEKAKTAVEELKEIDTTKLKVRVVDINDIIIAKEAVEETEKRMKVNKEEVGIYVGLVTKASDLNKISERKYNPQFPIDPTPPLETQYKEYQEKYGKIIQNLKSRIDQMEVAITAIKNVNEAKIKYDEYLASGFDDELVIAVNNADASIKKIEVKNTNLSSIKKSLESRLKEFSDKVIADSDYNEVNNKLKIIEDKLTVELMKKGKELDDTISLLDGSISRVIELSKKVKESNKSKEIKDRITAVNDVITATKAVVIAEGQEKNVLKDINTADNAINKINVTSMHKNIKDIDLFKKSLTVRLNEIKFIVDTSISEEKANILVGKAVGTKKEMDIKTAIEAVNKLAEGKIKEELNIAIKGIVDKLIEDAKNSISTAITSIRRNDKSISTNINEAKKAILLADNVVLLKEEYKDEYKDAIEGLNKNIESIDILVIALKSLQQAEKTSTQKDVDIALKDYNKAAVSNLDKMSEKDKVVYNEIVTDLDKRIKIIVKDLTDEAQNTSDAIDAVEKAENEMINDGDTSILDAQKIVDKVTDKTLKLGLQKRIDDIQIVKAAKLAVLKAKADANEKSVKEAETAISKVNGKYSVIIKDLSLTIAGLKGQLNISNLVAEAANLVQKAVEGRKPNDITIARDRVEALKPLVIIDETSGNDKNNPYNSLTKRLDDLVESIRKEEAGESTALETAKEELVEALKVIDDVNTDITKITEGASEKDDIQKAYAKIQIAKNRIIASNAAVRRLIDQKQQKDLLKEIDYANKEIDLAEDNIDVKEAVRLVTISSSSVMNATTEGAKSKARLDIAAARRAIDKIGHNDNKAIKVTILNTINSIEKKLTSDNDQELINLAVEEVNKAAELLAKAVRENKVMDPKTQEEIDKAIFAAKMAIGWISDNNKSAKDTLTGFINDIVLMFEAEKLGILNEDRIKNAEKAVAEAESKKGSDQLESYIRSARLRIKMIQKDGKAETEVIINDLNTRLDVLEGKGGSSGGNKPGGGSGSNKPGGSGGNSGTTPGNKVPTKPISDKDRVIGTTDPIWGKTNELKKKNPITGLPTYDATEYRVTQSKKKITELSTVLKTLPNANAKLVVGGKNISLGSKSYIHDKVNNSILVPIKFLGDELGFSVSLIDSPVTKGAKRILINGIVDGKTKSISIDLGSEYYYVNGNLIKASSKSLIEGGRTYIPVDLMVEHFGLTFSYSKSGDNIQLIIN